jgi:adenylate cyclase
LGRYKNYKESTQEHINDPSGSFFLIKYNMLKRILTSPWTALITLVLIVGIRIVDPAFVESVRLRYFDTLVTSKPAEVTGVHVVNIDEKALEQYGQFPFARNVYAGIIRDLYSRNAGLVVFNVLTPDRDRMGRDTAYVAALQKYPTVLPSIGSTQDRNEPRQPGSVTIGPYGLDTFVTYSGIIANIPPVESAAAGVGITNTLPEIDGVVRRMPMVVAVDGRLYPSLAMEVMRVAAGDSTFQVKINELGVEKMRIPQFGPVATDSLSRIWIDWSLVPERHSLMNLPDNFDGEIVIVGVSAAGLANPVATSLGEMLPQDLQAAVIGTVIANKMRPAITRPDWADGAEVLALVVAGLVLLFLTRWTYVGIGASVVVIGSIIPICSYAYSGHSWLMDATVPMAGLVLVLLHAYGVKFVAEFLAKQQIKKQFGTYLSPAMVEKLQKNPELLTLGGESRELSIMFTDVRGFTTISEHYGADVQGLTRIMNRYMTAMTAKIIENEGTLDKYIGDAQMAFWNAPLDDVDHARNAVRTALQMMESLDEFNREIVAEGIPPFGMGLGINTGTVVVGNMGSDQRFDYTCLGDSVNLASRLEGQSKPYGVRIILGPRTAELVRDSYPVAELDCIAVKGKTEGVRIYTLATETGLHQEFIKLYYAGNWKQAQALIPGCKQACPELEAYYGAMDERLATGKPSDWMGTYKATSK